MRQFKRQYQVRWCKQRKKMNSLNFARKTCHASLEYLTILLMQMYMFSLLLFLALFLKCSHTMLIRMHPNAFKGWHLQKCRKSTSTSNPLASVNVESLAVKCHDLPWQLQLISLYVQYNNCALGSHFYVTQPDEG